MTDLEKENEELKQRLRQYECAKSSKSVKTKKKKMLASLKGFEDLLHEAEVKGRAKHWSNCSLRDRFSR